MSVDVTTKSGFNMLIYKFLAAAVLQFISSAALAQTANEETEPLWEAGVGGGAIYEPDYPGSDEHKANGGAAPYIIYRGDIFRLGDGSIVKGVVMETERFEFDISFDASFDADSEDNDARMGMPDLDFLGEVGPQLTINLGEYHKGQLELELPVRAVFSTDFNDLDHRGYVFNPEISYGRDDLFENFNIFLELGASFATEELQDYFYQVEEQHATSSRMVYDAEAGYMGSELSVAFSYGITDRLRLFTGVQVSYYGGAANEDSPLLLDEITSTVGAGLVWSIYESDAQVPIR
ncbi:MAG: MipA/OmpV family protein [Hyphomicrobiales bacterium]|nr:MipA/OmpV family protein [Hyphomicrobiales bacterium]